MEEYNNNLYNEILNEIIKRKRISKLPEFILTGKRFGFGSDYKKYNVTRIIFDNNKFIYKNDFDTINLNDYNYNVIYLKTYETKIHQTQKTQWKDLKKCTTIIEIYDNENNKFYMYIRLGIKGYCNSCDGHNETNYRILYSSSFTDLILFVYKPYDIPDFLNSEAFISTDDKTISQEQIKQNINNKYIKEIIIDDILFTAKKYIIKYNQY